MVILKELGRRCQVFRVKQGYRQTDVAADTGYHFGNVSAFENGRNDNTRIFLWYLQHGMTLDEILGITEWEPPARYYRVYGTKVERIYKNGENVQE